MQTGQKQKNPRLNKNRRVTRTFSTLLRRLQLPKSTRRFVFSCQKQKTRAKGNGSIKRQKPLAHLYSGASNILNHRCWLYDTPIINFVNQNFP